MRERDLGPPVLAYLEGMQWDCYQEVPGPGGGVADIVCVNGKLVAVVELKTGLGFDVLSQAMGWLPWAHWVWVAVPAERVGTTARHLARSVCASFGVGVLELQHQRVIEMTAPAIQRRADVAKFRDRLRPEHKTFAPAGTNSGKAWTPFQETCKSVRTFLAAQGGAAELSAVVKGVKHHYASSSSARASLVQWAERGKIPGIEVFTPPRGKMQLRLTEGPTPGPIA